MISPQASSVDLDAVYPEIAAGSFVVLAKGGFNYPAEPAPRGTYVELYLVTTVTEVSREEFALSGKVTRLGLDGANYATVLERGPRGTSVFAQSERAGVRGVSGRRRGLRHRRPGDRERRRSVARPAAADPWQRVTSDGATLVHAATLVAAHADQPHSVHARDRSACCPSRSIDASVVVHANVAPASHGETVTQILGAGNAATPFQRFELKQLPLTFRAAANELGAASELTVRVDDIAWKARDTLFDAGPRDRAFTLSSDEQGRTFVQFGDGVRGARLPSGVNNVRRPLPQGPRASRATSRPRASPNSRRGRSV